MVGAIPVTRMVPASPITNGPSQFVVLGRPDASYSSSSNPSASLMLSIASSTPRPLSGIDTVPGHFLE